MEWEGEAFVFDLELILQQISEPALK